MSQRLHIGETDGGIYDCVITDAYNLRAKLEAEWLALADGLYCGPWKVRIGDKRLYRAIEPTIEGLFVSLGRQYPDEVSAIYDGESRIENPTRADLDAFLGREKKGARK